MTTDADFLRYSADKLDQLGGRIADCLDRLSSDQIWVRGSGSTNAIGNLALHLCGNVRQWIGTGVGRLPEVRDRDSEFAARGDVSPSELKALLERTISEALPIIRNLDAQRLSEKITVQAYTLTVLEAIYHVVEHFSGHTGQIIFATKLLTGGDFGFYRHIGQPAHGETLP